jgi:hypothetical protein
VQRDGVEYFNSGGWVDSKLTYLTIDEEGVRIHEFNEHEHNEHKFDKHEFDKPESDEHDYSERADHRDSGEERGKADSTAADFADESGLLEDAEYESVGR